MVAQKPCKVVITYDPKGGKIGWLMEIVSSRDGWSRFLDNSQVYLTTVLPGKKKGFHLHHQKESQVTCVKGKVVMAVWDGKKISEFKMSQTNPVTIRVPKKQAICFYNPGSEEAYILNLCSPPYDPKVREQESLDLPWEPKV